MFGALWAAHITSSDCATELWHSIDGGAGNDTLIGLSGTEYFTGVGGNATTTAETTKSVWTAGGQRPARLRRRYGAQSGGRGVDTCLHSEDGDRCAP